jgi:glucokinase
MDLALAIELEGSRLAVGVVSRGGKVVDSETVAPEADSQGGAIAYDRLVRALDVLRSRESRLEGETVVCGVSVGGGDHLGAGSHSAEEDAAERLRGRLSEAVGLPVHADSEGRGFALAEGWVGAAKGEDHYAALTIGETIAGGIVLGGGLLDGESGRAGRLGHVIVVPDGRRCPCGARGCLEAEVSVSAIEAVTGRALTEPSYDHMRHVGRLIGRAAASIANLLDLRLIVLGGRVTREYASTLLLAAQAELDASCRLSFSRGARISSARTPEPAGLVGAAAIGWRGLTEGR